MTIVDTTRELGEQVRRLRTQRGWTQTELARRTGLSRSFISDLEAGKTSVEFGRALRLLNALDAVLSVSPQSVDSALESTVGASGRVDLDELLHDLGETHG